MIIVHAQLQSHVLVLMLKAFTRRSPYFCKKNPPHKNPGNGPALLHDNPSYQPNIVTAVLSGTEASNVTQLQENPSYLPITVDSAGTDASNMMLFEENPSY